MLSLSNKQLPAGLLSLSALVFIAASGLVTLPARAQVGFALHVEGGGLVALSSHQRQVLGYDAGLTVMVRPELRLGRAFGIELGTGVLWLPSEAGDGRVVLVGGGLRLQPMLGRVGRFVLDAHASYARTGDLNRFALDTGLAFEFRASDNFALGPYARYTQVFHATDADGNDARILSFGLTMALGTSSADVEDRDADGVDDDHDLCVDEPAGSTPDPDRLGCPRADTDADGVYDTDDLCVNDPAGNVPDPERRGCPLLDTDGDGVSDRNDLCPNEAAGEHPDPARAGCPRADADSDGVYDSDDVCPSAAAGEHPDPSRAGCPDGDDDHDTILNSVDQCPREATGLSPDPARIGCPLPDRDHDGVPDATDACPEVPGAPSTNPRRNGCPGLVTVQRDRITIERPLYFATGRDTILRRSNGVLRALADALVLTPGIRRISIEGHADDVGEAEYNRDLSERRAQSVMRWLVAHNVDASRMEAHGLGETRPVAAGQSAEAREQNRQVAIRVTDPAPVSAEEGPQ